MTDEVRDIPPALSAEDWQGKTYWPDDGPMIRADLQLGLRVSDGGEAVNVGEDVSHLAALIALANAAMNDEDPRKLTHDTVRVLRQLPAFLHGAGMADDPDGAAHFVSDLADVIESYLPPVAGDSE